MFSKAIQPVPTCVSDVFFVRFAFILTTNGVFIFHLTLSGRIQRATQKTVSMKCLHGDGHVLAISYLSRAFVDFLPSVARGVGLKTCLCRGAGLGLQAIGGRSKAPCRLIGGFPTGDWEIATSSYNSSSGDSYVSEFVIASLGALWPLSITDVLPDSSELRETSRPLPETKTWRFSYMSPCQEGTRANWSHHYYIDWAWDS